MSEEERDDNSEIEKSVINDLVEVQKEELEVRRQEIEQQSKEAEYNYQYGVKSLEAQERDLKNERKNNQSVLNKILIFVGVILFLLVLFLCYLVYSDNSQLVIYILKPIAYIIAGGAGGYGYGYNKGYTKNKPDS